MKEIKKLPPNAKMKSRCFDKTSEELPFWNSRKKKLQEVIEQLIDEISKIESAARNPKSIPADLAKKTKAIWCVSGSGSYLKPLLDTPGDQHWQNKPWAHGTDKSRLDFCARLIKQLKSKGGRPILIYNGTEEQNLAFCQMAKNNLGLKTGEWFIPKGEIARTIDQVKNLSFPKNLTFEKNDIIAVVSHAPHLPRVMRMANKFKTFPGNALVKLHPLIFESRKNEQEFAESEIMGTLAYIAKGLAEVEPYPYKI